jgi:hypothetical protein
LRRSAVHFPETFPSLRRGGLKPGVAASDEYASRMDDWVRFQLPWGTGVDVPADDAATLARALRALGEAGDPDCASAAAIILRALADVPKQAAALLTDVETEAIAGVLEENPANLSGPLEELRLEILGRRS